MREVHRGRPRHPGQSHQQRRARGDVRVLHAGGHGPGVPEVPMVEEAPNYGATGELRALLPRLPNPSMEKIVERKPEYPFPFLIRIRDR